MSQGLPSVIKPELAICHPERTNYLDGMCQACAEKRLKRLETSPHLRSLPADARSLLVEVRHLKAVLDEQIAVAKTYLQYHAPIYAQLHLEGAETAAQKGDTRPAEWALEHLKSPAGTAVVEAPTKVAADTGVKVFVGVKIGGMPEQMLTADVVEINASGDVS